ncbi:MAG TPA: SEC-C metal-binding domain-containing protein, partial [Chloroflexota bacterium]|nr:SEC-C metal-binding domain-containing protein [Chloroflexota bacterium]
LSIIDRRWIQHIDAVDELREGVQLQSAGQRDPLVEFRKTASSMFADLQATIRHEVVHVIYQFEVQVHAPPPPPSISIVPGGASPRAPQPQPLALASAAPPAGPAVATAPPPVARAEGPALTRTSSGPARPPNASKLGRNDPCWCGSGKKFKQCHGGA